MIAIRAASPDDAKAIAVIYGYYVEHDLATFDETPPPASYFADRIETAPHPYLVAEDENGKVIGYCYAVQYRDRPAYRHTVETSIYLGPDARGKGVGKALMEALLAQLKQDPTPIKQLIAGIATADHDPTIGRASIALHESLGFRQVGLFAKTGHKFDQWLNVAFYQRTL